MKLKPSYSPLKLNTILYIAKTQPQPLLNSAKQTLSVAEAQSWPYEGHGFWKHRKLHCSSP